MNIKTILCNFINKMKITKKFIQHNFVHFPKIENSFENIVLVELNKLSDLHILYTYLSCQLSAYINLTN